ncbi:helix-turn-helix domain-containing protein [Deinococcus sp.]|uniref:helix-turn-helix domain-containing protein n=1 Tax=Deinococcus sp. TaxID=47478 RepID=UPI003B5BC377
MNPISAFQRTGRTLHARRRLLGLTLGTLAAESGLSPALLSALERGEYDPRSLHLAAVQALTRILDLGPSTLHPD